MDLEKLLVLLVAMVTVGILQHLDDTEDQLDPKWSAPLVNAENTPSVKTRAVPGRIGVPVTTAADIQRAADSSRDSKPYQISIAHLDPAEDPSRYTSVNTMAPSPVAQVDRKDWPTPTNTTGTTVVPVVPVVPAPKPKPKPKIEWNPVDDWYWDGY
tara:strand:- start:3340 stop:3807 length:468 start_codon:yes stop_codon:yes gene_type:complete